MNILLNAIQEAIINSLRQQQQIDLNVMAKHLNCGEATLKTALNQLIALQFPICQIRAECYAMNFSWQPLDAIELAKCLNIPCPNIHAFTILDSTNVYLKNPIFSGQDLICFAEMQTNGKGRFGRTWQSAFGLNLYLSLRVCLPISVNKISGLSLVTGLAVCAALEDYPLMIKWPNDLWIHQKKCAGILIELCSYQAEKTEVVIGLGLNINECHAKDWTSLALFKEKKQDRQQIMTAVIQSIYQYLRIFSQQGLEAFMTEWQTKDVLFHQTIRIQKAQEIFEGQAQGINDLGHLLVKTKKQLQAFDGGEVTIKL